jgi:flagellar biosynthesis GTPase FlhF
MSAVATRTYRGSSLEELLPRIRAELGPDAVVTKRREGIVGGIAGFFGKRCVEVEACAPPPASPPRPALPARDVAGAYVALAQAGPLEDGAWPGADDEARPRARDGGTLMDAILAEDSRFADALLEAAARETEASPRGEAEALRAALLAAAVPRPLGEELLTEAERERCAFAPDGPLLPHLRRALGRRLRVSSRRGGRRRIALLGPPGCGRTLAAAKLCRSYARAGLAVCALSMEPARRAMRLAELTDGAGVELDIANSPASVAARGRAGGFDVIVADTPPVDADDARSLSWAQELIAAFRPGECLLVLPSGYPADGGRLLVRELRSRVRLHGLVLTRAGEGQPATPLGLAVAEGLPVAYVAQGQEAAGGLVPAEAEELMRMVLA